VATDYITVPEFKSFLGRSVVEDDAVIAQLATTASRWVDSKSGRRFYADSVATARFFHPTTTRLVKLDDCATITSVATDEADTGLYATAWTAADYVTLPLNGVGSNGASGWPISALSAVATVTFPGFIRPTVKVTATWGWAAVPDDIKTACLYYTHRLFYLRDTPGGTTMSVDFGAQPIRQVRDIESLIAPYATMNAADGRFLVH
jgi:hypothetical protein